MSAALRRLDPLLRTALVLLVAAVAFVGFASWSWASAPRTLSAARTRDQALRAGEQAVLNFNTLDYRHVGRGLRLWEHSSTGALRHEVVVGQSLFAQQIEQARTITTARILDAALTSLNDRAGRAGLIVAIQVTVTPSHGKPDTKLTRLAGQLTRTASGWKLSALSQAPVQKVTS